MTVIFTVIAGDQIRQKDLNSKKVCSGKIYQRSMGKAVSNIGSLSEDKDPFVAEFISRREN